ncbi:MAG: hypothetical protein H6898_09440 [Rhodobacter sp.]|nr:hypothetical protein [Paracoccaceae bacterium]MCC0076793.1 hypothetical protein [Rhodobacter sp.]
MPLSILLPLVVLGIAAIGVLLHLSGQSRRFDIADAAVARREWLRHWPGDTVRAVHLAGGAALVETAQGLGILRAFGADTTAHRLTGLTERGLALRLSFGDFAAPDATLPLPERDRAAWLALWREHHA